MCLPTFHNRCKFGHNRFISLDVGAEYGHRDITAQGNFVKTLFLIQGIPKRMKYITNHSPPP